MIRFRKPRIPAGFEKRVEPTRTRIAGRSRGEKPDFKGREIWKEFKPYLAKAQEYKCGFCEVKIATDRFKGDVEHYRPKGRVDQLRFVNDKRKQDPLWKSGYWWLAYSWDNYLLACNRCNSAYKKNFFPIREKQDPQFPPTEGDENNEHPLVLNPFMLTDPTNHLSFDLIGQVRVRKMSELARNTIDVCGLDREELRDMREKTADLAHNHIDRLKAALQNGESVSSELLPDIYRLGRIQVEHAGMVRSIFTQRTGHSWQWLVKEVAFILSKRIASPRGSSSRTLEHMHDLGAEGLPEVKKTYESETGQTWRSLTSRIAQIKCDQLQAGIDSGDRLSSLQSILQSIYNLGYRRADIRSDFQTRIGQTWAWLETKVNELAR